MRKQLAIVLVALIILFGGIFGVKFCANYRAAVAAAHQSLPPVTVSTGLARDEPWSPEINVVGSLKAVRGTEITAQIAGNVTRIVFSSGECVHEGQLLLQQDNSIQLAQLHVDQARLQLARTTLTRTQNSTGPVL